MMKRHFYIKTVASMLLAASVGMSLASCEDDDDYTIVIPANPQFVESTPTNGSTIEAAAAQVVKVKYDKMIFFDSSRASEIGISAGSITSAKVYGADSVLTIVADMEDLATTYTITIPDGLVLGTNGTKAAGVTITYSTPDPGAVSQTPVFATSSAAKSLYSYLYEQYGQKTLSGMMADVAWNHDKSDAVYALTGKYPAINGYDYIHLPASLKGANWIDYSDITPVKEWADAGGIVNIGWHWLVPTTEVSVSEEEAGEKEETPSSDNEETIWSGEVNVGTAWGVSESVASSAFSSVVEGSVLRVYVSENSDAEYWQVKLMDSSWTTLTSYADVDNGWGCIALSAGQAYVDIVLNAADVALLQSGGAILSGYGVTYSKLTIVGGASTSDAGDAIWSGEVNVGTAWAVSESIAASKFSDIAEGDVLTIELSENSDAEYWQVKLMDSNWTTLTSYADIDNGWGCIALESGATSCSITLNEADVTSIKAGGIILSGYGITYKSISLSSGNKSLKATSVSSLDPNKDFSYEPNKGFDLKNAVTPGTWEYDYVQYDLANITSYLKLLKDANIPVIWRPLHEASGGWFWWGTDAASFKKLWIMVYDYFKAEGLDNLIWVWTSQIGDNDWYPGDEYVDVIGCDIYGSSPEPAASYNKLKSTYPNKIITLSECGWSSYTSSRISAISSQIESGAKWSWFMPWYSGSSEANPHADDAWWQDAMNCESVITRDQLPSFK